MPDTIRPCARQMCLASTWTLRTTVTAAHSKDTTRICSIVHMVVPILISYYHRPPTVPAQCSDCVGRTCEPVSEKDSVFATAAPASSIAGICQCMAQHSAQNLQLLNSAPNPQHCLAPVGVITLVLLVRKCQP